MSKKSSRSVRARREEMQARKKRQRLITAVVVIGGLLGLAAIVFLTRQITRTTPEDVSLPESLTPPPGADGTAWGPADAPVLVEEFSDFQ
jgi:hypothetical protein